MDIQIEGFFRDPLFLEYVLWLIYGVKEEGKIRFCRCTWNRGVEGDPLCLNSHRTPMVRCFRAHQADSVFPW